jgi:hypothetical protein
MNNFSAALAIFCAFNATPIMRLKDTWQVKCTAYFEAF